MTTATSSFRSELIGEDATHAPVESYAGRGPKFGHPYRRTCDCLVCADSRAAMGLGAPTFLDLLADAQRFNRGDVSKRPASARVGYGARVRP